MPTIYRGDGFDVMIYTNDHRPSHVHIFKAEAEVVIYLGNAHASPQVRENIGMSAKDERRALVIVGKYQAEFIEEWRRIHGDD